MSQDTNVENLIINKLTKAQYESITNPDPTQLYFITDEGESISTLDDVSLNNIANGQILKYNATTQKWENSTVGGGTWGNITGTLSNQIDLQTALDAKQNTISDLSTIRSGASLGATALQPNDNITELVNNADYITSSALTPYVLSSSLATVATTGDYDDLTNKPTIPTVNNGTLTIQKNGTTVGTFTANDTNNVTANISVPTSISDLTDDTSTYPIDKADTLTGLTASVSELNYVDGVTGNIQAQIDNKADTTLSNVSSIDSNSAVQTALDEKVNKSGDTMTGALSIDTDGINLNLNNPNLTKGTNPSSTKYISILMNDGSNSSSWQAKRLGMIEHQSLTDGTERIVIAPYRNVANSRDNATFAISIPQSGDGYCTFPSTICCDGQFVNKTTQIMNGVSLNGSSNLTYTLSDLPSDGHSYLVWLTASVTTGNTSGNYVQLKIYSDAVNNNLQVCATRTKTTSTVGASGSIIIPVSSSRRIYVVRETNFNGTASLWLKGYRRIGTNA